MNDCDNIALMRMGRQFKRGVIMPPFSMPSCFALHPSNQDHRPPGLTHHSPPPPPHTVQHNLHSCTPKPASCLSYMLLRTLAFARRPAAAAIFKASTIRLPLCPHPTARAASNSTNAMKFETLAIETGKAEAPGVAFVKMNRPQKRNAMNSKFWGECKTAFEALGEDGGVRAIVLMGEGKVFTSGLDLSDIGIDLMGGGGDGVDVARQALKIKRHVTRMQDAFNAIEKIPQPVIAAIHGACIGGGIDLIAACDIRLASTETVFSIKEVDIGLAADLGTLQRLPRITGNESLLRELAFTGRNFTCAEGQLLGLFSRVLPSPTDTLAAATALAVEIAKKSPVAVAGTKVNLLYSRDHASVQDGLDNMTTWNMSALQSEDIGRAVHGAMTKETPTFSKL